MTNDRETLIELKAGLFVLRYERSHAAGAAPTVLVRPTPESEADIEVISAPGERPGVIVAPGGCVIVRAERSGSVHVTIHAASGAGTADAELRLEPLHAGRASLGGGAEVGAPARASRAQRGGAREGEVQAPGVAFTGHVSRRGDVQVEAGEWVAGPDAPAPIEGIELRVVGLQGVAIEYQALIGGPGGAWTRWEVQAYCGTRGQFKALHGVRLRLSGPGAAAFEIEAEALFLGSTTSRRKGAEIEFVSGGGADPLVGLKVALISVQARGSQTDKRSTSFDPEGNRQLGRVRVFRASGMRS